LSLIG